MRTILLIVLGVAWSALGGLRIGEICPRPSALDANGRESGWVELVNDGAAAVDLADYELVIRKRGKKRGAQGDGEVNLLPRVVAPGARTLVYTSEMYDNAEDYGGDGETVKTYGHDLMVVPVKISPKKFPLVELYCGTNKSEKVLCDALAVPSDIPDGSSLAHGERGLVVLAHPTPGTVNNLSGASVVGPEIGPLRGVKHDLFDHEPFPCATNGFAAVVANNGSSSAFTVKWPLEFMFTEAVSGTGRSYTVGVEPYNPGGTFEWRMENEELRMGAGDSGIFHSPLTILHLAGGACGCVSGNGYVVTFGCSSTCTCGGNCLAVGAFSFEYAVFAVTGGVCRCGFDDPPAPGQPTFEPLDEPTLSVNFSAPAVIFEDAYVDSPGVTRPRRSTRTRLTVSAWGGPNGGTLTLASQNLDKLAPVACGPMVLPSSVTLAPYQEWSVSYLCEGAEASSEVADVSVLGILLDSASSLAVTGRTELTSVKVTFKPDYPVGNFINRHVIGVREAAKISWIPQALTLQVLTEGNEDLVPQNGKCNYRAPLILSTTNLIAKYGVVQFPIKIDVKEPERILVRSVEVFDYGVPKGVAGGAGMELALYIYPTNVSFMGIAVQEVPSNYRDPWGYFLKEDFRDLWSHTHERSAGVWHDVGVGNLFMYDIAEMGDAYPGVRTDGTIGDIDDHAWMPGGMNWMIPVGWNENGSDENDAPVKIIETYWQRFRISAVGTVEVEKLGYVVERGTNNVVRLNGIIQHREDLRPR